MKRIQRKRTKGWKAPLDSQGRKPIYCGRGRGSYGIFGNPFTLDSTSDYCKTHEACTGAFGDWLAGHAFREVEPERRAEILRRLRAGELRNRVLMCWCKEAQPGETPRCHADWLLYLSQRMHPPEPMVTIQGPAPVLSPSLLKRAMP